MSVDFNLLPQIPSSVSELLENELERLQNLPQLHYDFVCGIKIIDINLAILYQNMDFLEKIDRKYEGKNYIKFLCETRNTMYLALDWIEECYSILLPTERLSREFISGTYSRNNYEYRTDIPVIAMKEPEQKKKKKKKLTAGKTIIQGAEEALLWVQEHMKEKEESKSNSEENSQNISHHDESD